LLWENSRKIRLTIDLPTGLRLEELYNVDSNALRLEDSRTTISDFEVNGYLGGVIISRIEKQPSVVKSLKFSVVENGSEVAYVRDVRFFRPDVNITSAPKTIRIIVGNNRRLRIDGKILLSNLGEGTGIIKLSVSDKSQVKEGLPERFNKFVTGLFKDLTVNLQEVAEKFPQHKGLILQAIRVLKNPMPKEREEQKETREFVEKIEGVFGGDEEFMEEYLLAVLNAIIRNMSLAWDVGSFLAYLRSILKQRLLLLNAINVLKVTKRPRRLVSELLVTDLLQQPYDNVKLPNIILQANKTCDVPIYRIVESVSQGMN